MALYIGTSGWAYPEWKPAFYPKDVTRKGFLSYYGSVFDACEINTSFYGRQDETTFNRWATEVPASFRFCIKAHRRLSHARDWGSDAQVAFAGDFVATLTPLRAKLGPLLVQFPSYRERDDVALAALLGALAPLPVAVEFRNASWNAPEVMELIREHRGTLCVADVEGPVPQELPAGDFAYVRLRRARYSPAERDAWTRLLVESARGRPVYAFSKHEGAPPDDPFAGVGLARYLTSVQKG